MKRFLRRIWKRGILSTFLAGFFVVLPVAITLAIMAWMGAVVHRWLGPESTVGEALLNVGMRFATDESTAMVLGWALALAGIWLFGLLVKSAARYGFADAVDAFVTHVPVIRSIYRPVSQVVAMLKSEPQTKAMAVVYCEFGGPSGGAFLGLRPSTRSYRFGGRDCQLLYIPTSPVPMSGGIVFVPTTAVHEIDMDVESLMQIYFSLGVMCEKVAPEKYLSPGVLPSGNSPTSDS